jgi:invasion protein IalB
MAHLGYERLTRRCLVALIAAAGSFPLAAAAQNAQAPDTPWIKICNTIAENNKELCLVTQELRADTNQFIASATLRQFTGEPTISFIVAVPPGMLLQPGVRAQVDEGKQQEIKYGICFPNACYGELEVNAEFIASMKAGGQLKITSLRQNGDPVTFPMTLAGFTKVYDGAGLDPKQAEAKQDDLNKALQARAQEARQKLIEQQQKETAN